MRPVSLVVTVGAIRASTSMASAQAIDWQKVDDAFGRKPAAVAGDAHRHGFPRTDLNAWSRHRCSRGSLYQRRQGRQAGNGNPTFGLATSPGQPNDAAGPRVRQWRQ
jgi:hypothetical protein